MQVFSAGIGSLAGFVLRHGHPFINSLIMGTKLQIAQVIWRFCRKGLFVRKMQEGRNGPGNPAPAKISGWEHEGRRYIITMRHTNHRWRFVRAFQARTAWPNRHSPRPSAGSSAMTTIWFFQNASSFGVAHGRISDNVRTRQGRIPN